MSNFVKKINGLFTISVDDKEYPNLVVDSGLSNIFKKSDITSLCQTLKVYDDSTEVAPGDTTYANPSASSANVTSTQYGVSGTGTSDYFYMKRTWTFYRGQIEGVISKLAVFSDDGTLYAAALLRTPEGELDPVRPLYAPKVEITYESRWHFKQGDNYTIGTPVYFSAEGLVIVKTNMASKNSQFSYNRMNEPFTVTGVELFSDDITTDDTAPVESLGLVSAVDYSVTYIDDFNVFGQRLTIVLPETKYINDLPIATIVVTTTRGKWQLGFEGGIAKPTLSKREVEITVPFIHGTVSATGEIIPTGNPDAIDSIFSSLQNATYDVSSREMRYTGSGDVLGVPSYFGNLKNANTQIQVRVPDSGIITIAMGLSDNIETYLDGTVEGVLLKIQSLETLTGSVENTVIDAPNMLFAAGDIAAISVINGVVTIENLNESTKFETEPASTFTSLPSEVILGAINVTSGSSLVIY